MADFEDVEKVLGTYTLEEILELNDLTDEETLYFLVEKEFLTLPNPRPL